MIPAAVAPLPSPAVQSGLRDFPDRLSPMLVKELRQGLKSHLFTWGLIAMQLALIIMTLISMDEGNSRDINSFFWWSVAGPVCLLLPLRVANALRDESSGNTLDTLLLTHLSAWRITLGKWLATCALQVLVAMTALPYLILRYFAGGVNMPLEVAWLGVYILFGMVTTAIMLGLSWFPHFLIRSIFMLAVLAGAAGFCGGTIDEISRANDYGLDTIYREMRWPGVIYILTMVSWVAFFFLDLAAARLAPISENRATRRRLVALAVLSICGACCALPDYGRREISVVLATMLAMSMFLPCVQAICERPANFAPVLQPFVKRGLPGRLAGRVLYPGWHTGLIFTLLLIFTAAGLAAWQIWQISNYYSSASSGASAYRREYYEEFVVGILIAAGGTLGVLVLPLVAWHLLRGMIRWDFWRWLLVMVIAFVFHFAVCMAAYRTSPAVYYANYLLPTGSLVVLPVADVQADEAYLWQDYGSSQSDWENRWRSRQALENRLRREHGLVAGISVLLWLVAALALAAREMRHTRRAEQEMA